MSLEKTSWRLLVNSPAQGADGIWRWTSPCWSMSDAAKSLPTLGAYLLGVRPVFRLAMPTFSRSIEWCSFA